MNELGQKGNKNNEDFMIHVLKNLPKHYDMILNRLENRLTATRDDVLTINVIRYEKIKSKKKKK